MSTEGPRGEELSALRALERDGTVRLVVLEGAPGAGSAALLDAWLAGARNVLCIEDSASIERIVLAALAKLSPVRRARHAASALVSSAPASPVTDLLAASERRLRLREETATLLTEIGREGDRAIVVLDGERAERSALELVLHLALSDRCPALFVVQVSGPRFAPLARASQHPCARTITLRPLDREGIRALLATPEIVDAVLERTGGLPELVVRMARGEPLTSAEVEPSCDPIDALISAGRHDDACALARDAAEMLAARHADVDAADLLLRVVSAVPRAPRSLRARLAELLFVAGDHAHALEIAERLCAEDPKDAHAMAMLGRLLAFRGRHARAIEVLERARIDAVVAIEADALLADARYAAGDLEGAQDLATAVLARASSDTVSLDAENTLAKIEIARGDLAPAEARLERALSRALALGLARHACQALNNLAIVAIGKGELAAASQAFERMIELGREHGVLFYRGIAHKNLAVARALEGSYEEALDHAERALAMLAGSADESLLARVAFNTADLHTSIGDPYRALALVAHARQQAGDLLSASVEHEGLRVEAAAHAELGHGSEARRAYERAIELAGAIGDRRAADDARLGLALLAIGAHETDEARALLDRVGEPRDLRARARVALARALLADGELEIPLARIAVERADATGDPLLGQPPRLELARALYDAGLRERAEEELRAIRARERSLAARVPEALRPLFEERRFARRVTSFERAMTTPPTLSIGALAYERVLGGGGSIYALRKRIERECVERALRDADGNISRAADLLGMKRPRLSKLVHAWGLKK